MVGEDAVETIFQSQDFLGLDADVAGGALGAAPRLMDHDAGVRQGEPLAGSAGGQQYRAHAGGLADAVGADIAAENLHGVVDCQAGSDRTARRSDVEIDVFLRLL